MLTAIKTCRLCDSTALVPILNLGEQALTGIFPKSKHEDIATAPLVLLNCRQCGLVQLQHSYAPNKLYGSDYGYRSALNQSMVSHLHHTQETLQNIVTLSPGDGVLDIGSNDGTYLNFYPAHSYTLIGFDPAAEKFKSNYRDDIHLIIDFFSAHKMQQDFNSIPIKIITSIAMFYDLEHPLAFAQSIYDILEDDGIWHLEQSYLPLLLTNNAYDTVCHEHLAYYALRQIKYITDQVGFKIIRLEKNAVNGGSFAITVAKRSAPYQEVNHMIANCLAEEEKLGLNDLTLYQKFATNIETEREKLLKLLIDLKHQQKKVYGYGASTKGNVLLQHTGIDDSLLTCIAEINADKFGHYTPGTLIPILSEQEAHTLQPDYFLVLPWHFKNNILAREQPYLQRGGKFIFPLPTLEVC